MGQSCGRDPGLPVGNVTHADAVAFCDWLSTSSGTKHRLPTEAEWEYACRAGTAGDWSFGPADRVGEFAWFAGNRDNRVRPVGGKKPNAFGLHDTHGNVWEWCADWHDPKGYPPGPALDPAGPPTGEKRVLRGGSYSYTPEFLRSAYRAGYYPDLPYHKFGFRVVRESSAN